MTLSGLISELSQRGVKLWVENNELQVRAPKGALTPELRALLVSHKHELLTKLRQGHTGSMPLVAVARAEHLPLSLEQERLWAAAQFVPNNAMHHIVQAIRLTGLLDHSALQRTLQEIVARHETLRTSFTVVNEQPVQLIAPALPVDLPMVTIPTGAEIEAAIAAIVNEEAQRPFDLDKGPLWRFKLIQIHESAHVLVLVIHHVITDGTSMGIFIHELTELYAAFQMGKPSPLPILSIQYADFASWQRQWLQSAALKEHLTYWQKQLAHAPAFLDLPTDYPRPAVRSNQNTYYAFKLPLALCDQLEQRSKEAEATLFMTLLAGFKLLLYRYSGQEDILIGSPTSGRIHPDVQPLIGFFAYPIVLRTSLSGNPSFQELLGRMREVTLSAYAHQDVPLSKVVEVAQPQRSTNYNPLFQVLFGFASQALPDLKTNQLSFSPIADSLRTSTEFDLFLTLFGTEQGLSGMLEYNPDLFAADTIAALMDAYQALLAVVAASPQTRLREIELPPTLQAKINAARAREQKQMLAITATFTAEPLRDALAFWMQELGLLSQIEFAPYNQVFQQLLDPTSLLARNETGVNIVLVRPYDWVRFDPHADNFNQMLEQNRQQLVAAIQAAAARTSTPYLVCLCPAAPAPMNNPVQARFLEQLEAALAAELKAISGVYVVTAAELAATYPVEQIYDPLTDKEGHIPFTLPFFSALGSQLARVIHALHRPPYKVIVLDCDNTLWQGVCGEDGADGVVLSSPFLALQEFMIQKVKEGYLLCLCSKNSEEDVFQVFAQRQEMRLQRHHLVSWRINWQPKSENIKALAKELDLGLDSFIFLDDNPLECADVQANCPEVLTLQLPEETKQIPTFLTHLWAFDRLKVTAEDQKRTLFYQQNAQREQLRQRAPTLQEYLSSLAITIQIKGMTPGQLARVAQLTQRTNQFNTTTLRRSESEIQHLCEAEGYTCLVTEVSDRFGDHGLVGVIMFNVTGDTLNVDSFLMSCRVLGLGVEHRLLAHIGEIAQEKHCRWVDVRYKPTRSNKPMLNFLECVGEQFKIPLEEGHTYRLPVDFCQAIRYQPDSRGIDPETQLDQPTENKVTRKPRANVALFTRIATDLHDAQQILQVIASQEQARSVQAQPFVAPRDELERLLAANWAKLLRVNEVGIHDNFFELGGDSIQGVIFFNQLQKQLGEMVHIPALFNAPTVAQMAVYLKQQYGRAVATMLGAAPSITTGQSQEKVNATHVARFRQMLPPLPYAPGQGPKNPSAIFILSPLRSGSTLLRVMLNGHDRLFAPPELHLLSFATLPERRSAFDGPHSAFREGTIRALMELKGCSLEVAAAYMADLEAQKLTVQQFYGRMQADLGERILIDKTPSYALDMEILKRAEAYFENPRYIHLRRHPYGSIHSFEKARFDQFFLMYQHTFSPRQLAELNWLVSHQNILQFLSEVPPERQIAITFEELVGQSEATMQRLARFIGIDFTPDLLQPYDNKKPRMTDGIHAESRMLGDVNFHQHRAINPQVASSWQEEYQEDFLSEISWELATVMGYQRTAAKPVTAPWSPLVTLQPEGSLPPFFCVHPIGGHAFGYLNLARHLGVERPFIALQAVGLDGKQAPLPSIEAMATTYINAIKTVQPEGPYYLGGWSFGGMVAFEMANQLQKAGQAVARLILIDTPVKPMPVPQLSLDSTSLPSDEMMRSYMARDFSALASSNFSQLPEEYTAAQEHFFALFKAHYQARLKYTPQCYQGDLVLLYAHSQTVDILAGWSERVAGELTTIAIPGDHYSIMRVPHVEHLGQTLAQFLK